MIVSLIIWQVSLYKEACQEKMRHNYKYICLQIRMFMFEDLFKMFRRPNEATRKSAIQNNEKAIVPLN